jgi:hypothetical protein
MTKLARTNQFNRSGTVHYRVEQGENGVSAVSLAIDFERVPEPEHSYITDYFEVHRTDEDVLMVFGKTDFPSETELRNKIEIYFPFHPFMHQLWKSTRKVEQALLDSFEKKGKIAKAQGHVHSPGAKVQTLTANNALVVNSGGQCVMDFFLIAAKDIWLKTKKGDPLNVSAIVRVFMNERILLGFLKRCDEIAEEVKDELEIPVVEDNDETLESFEL